MVARAWKTPEKSQKPRPPVVFIDTPTKARLYRDELVKQGRVEIALDTEFDKDDYNKVSDISLMSYSWGRGVRRVVLAELVKDYYAEYLSASTTRGVYQNYKADHDSFELLGIDTVPSFYADTEMLSFLRDETQLKHGLKAQCRTYLHWPRKEYGERFSYPVPGKKKPLGLTPRPIVSGKLPDEALAVKSAADWLRDLIEYSGDDAESTILLEQQHKAYLQSIGYWETYLKVDRPYTLTLMNMSARGVPIDLPYLRTILRKVEISMLRCEHSFRAAIGKPDFNIQSNPQLQQLFFDELNWPEREDLRTATGKPQINEEALRWYINEHGFELAELKLTHAKAKTLKGTFLEGLINGVNEDGRLRSDFIQTGARSGRISSRKFTVSREVSYLTPKRREKRTRIKKFKIGANLQNIPVRKEKDPHGIRRGFRAPLIGEETALGDIAKEEYELTVADLSGAELLMMIYWASTLTDDSPMLATMLKYGSPSAIHAFTAIQMYGDTLSPDGTTRLRDIKMDDWRMVKKLFPDQYLKAKNNNFGLLYGAMAKRIAQLLRLDYRDPRVLEAIQDEIDSWNDLYPEVRVFQGSMVKHGYKHGWVPIIDGRRGNVRPYLISEEFGMRSYGERLCMNTPCQGSIAAIMRVAQNIIERDEELRDLHAPQILTVHDEMVLENPKRHSPQVRRRLCEIMAMPYRRKFPFKMDIEAKSGSNWMTAKA